jgi:hypothetical protein
MILQQFQYPHNSSNTSAMFVIDTDLISASD